MRKGVKRITREQILGEMAVQFIGRRFLDMGFPWHPTNLRAQLNAQELRPLPALLAIEPVWPRTGWTAPRVRCGHAGRTLAHRPEPPTHSTRSIGLGRSPSRAVP